MAHLMENEKNSPWTEIDFEDKEQAVEKLFTILAEKLEQRVKKEKKKKAGKPKGKYTKGFETELFTFDFDKENIDKGTYDEILPDLQMRMRGVKTGRIQFEKSGS